MSSRDEHIPAADRGRNLRLDDNLMAHSYVDFGERFVRINDQLLTILVLIMAEVVRGERYGDRLQQAVSRWKRQTLEAPPGLIDIRLDAIAATTDDLASLRTLLDETDAASTAHGETFPGYLLTEWAGPTSIKFVDVETGLILRESAKWKTLLESP